MAAPPGASSGAGSEPQDARTHLREMTAEAPIPFSRYMDLALYHPTWGYYTRPGGPRRTGDGGDFLTAPTTHRFFGTAIGRSVADWAENHDLAKVHVLEMGGGTGELADGILSAAGNRVASYVFVERSPAHRDGASRLLHRPDRGMDVEVLADPPRSMPGPTFLVANEVLDNLPCSLLRLSPRGEGGVAVEEVHVRFTAEGGGEEVLGPAPESREFIEAYLARHPDLAQIEDPVLYPAPVAATRFIDDALSIDGVQAALLLDYAATTRDLLGSTSSRGTVTTHRAHQRASDPYAAPGEEDITYTVDVDAIAWAFARRGWRLWGPTTQGRFLIDLGAAEEVARHAAQVRTARGANDFLLLKELFLPGGMGERFKALLAEHPDAVSPRTPKGFGAGPMAL